MGFFSIELTKLNLKLLPKNEVSNVPKNSEQEEQRPELQIARTIDSKFYKTTVIGIAAELTNRSDYRAQTQTSALMET